MLLALLAAFAALILRAPEQLCKFGVFIGLCVLDIANQAQHVLQGLLGEPDQALVLVLGPGDLSGLLR